MFLERRGRERLESGRETLLPARWAGFLLAAVVVLGAACSENFNDVRRTPGGAGAAGAAGDGLAGSAGGGAGGSSGSGAGGSAGAAQAGQGGQAGQAGAAGGPGGASGASGASGAGAGGTGGCTKGETRCQDSGVQTCDGSGNWGAASSCSLGCAEGKCAGVTQLALGDHTTYALVGSGLVLAWGDNHQGQMGKGYAEGTQPKPSVVPLKDKALGIAAGGDTACAVVTGGKVLCWGRNDKGQVGDGSSGAAKPSPTEVDVGGEAKVVALGKSHGCAGLAGGGVRCWGDDSHGQLGDGKSGAGLLHASPVLVIGLASEVTLLALGNARSCAVAPQGPVCWGFAGFSEPGTPGDDQLMPSGIAGLSATTTLSLGAYHGCARLETGAARCFGANDKGQLGDGAVSAGEGSAVPVVGGVGVGDSLAEKVAAGRAHGCARLGSGLVKCWGDNAMGQLGLETPSSTGTPTTVPGLLEVDSVFAGGDHTCALLVSGGVRCWGDGSMGELGPGASGPSSKPVEVVLP